MGFTGARMLYLLDVFFLALYLLSDGCALLKHTWKQKRYFADHPDILQITVKLFLNIPDTLRAGQHKPLCI